MLRHCCHQAAQRLEPAKTSRPRWRKPAGLATITAGATAVAAFIRRRMKPGRATADTAADPDGSAPGAQAGNGQAAPKKDADTKAADTDNAADVRTS